MVCKHYVCKLGLVYTLFSIRINRSLDRAISLLTFSLIMLAGSFYVHCFWVNCINRQSLIKTQVQQG